MIARALVLLLAWIFTGYAAADPQCWTLYHGEHNWFGYPNYDDCHKLLFGDHDLSGIAAIDARSHAFVVASASGREFESESEWENRVVLPKFWSNCQDPFPCLPSYKAACNMRTKLIVGCERIAGCKIALSPTSVADMAGERRIERETGQWLPIAETGQNVNERCVGGREPGGQHTGGFDKTGDTGRLIILLYQPGSPIDREIERDLAANGIVTVAAADLYDSSEYDSAEGDLNNLHDEFTTLLNINVEVNLPRPRSRFEDLWGYSHVGKSDPRVKNLGSSWVVDYSSVTSLLPVDRATTSLSAFYEHVVEMAAEKLGNATAPVKSLEFTSKGVSLSLTSPAPIRWDWIIRFARAMSLSLHSSWAVLYNAIARNAYWDVATINAVLRIASA